MKASSSSQATEHGRPTNENTLRMYIRDSENTLMYSPEKYSGNKFFGQWNKVMLLQTMLFAESREKYLNKYNAELKAQLELESVPACFNTCVTEVRSGLSSTEKNCMRDCYLKQLSSRDDFNMLVQQKLAYENTKAMRERLV